MELKSGMDVLNIDVPPWMDRQAKTGIRMFDVALSADDEGLTPSTVCLFTGEPGAGKTTLALQLADSCTAMGHVALVNTNEESLYQVRRVVRRLGLKNGFIVGNEQMLDDIIALYEDVIARPSSAEKQIFVFLDSLQTVDDGKYSSGHTNQMTAVRVMQHCSKLAKRAPYPIITVIGQVNKSGDEFAGKMRIKHDADVHLHLSFDREMRSPTWGMRCLDVRKNRFGKSSHAVFLAMDERFGLVSAQT